MPDEEPPVVDYKQSSKSVREDFGLRVAKKRLPILVFFIVLMFVARYVFELYYGKAR